MTLQTSYESLVEQYRAAGFTEAQAFAEAAREVRLTTGEIEFGRSEEELTEIRASYAELVGAVRESAGVSEEFPAGEFAIEGFNTGSWSMFEKEEAY